MTTPDLSTEQEMPVRNDSPSIQGMVRADLETREAIGVERYGTALQPNNGRDALRDAYEEALDLACYLRQAIAERPREDVGAAVAAVRAELEPQLRRKDDLIIELRRPLAAAERQLDIARELIGTVRSIAETWRTDPGVYPDGAADPLEQIATVLLGPRPTRKQEARRG